MFLLFCPIDFIFFARNLIEPINVNVKSSCSPGSGGDSGNTCGSSVEATNTTSIPLESDGLIIEFLARHNFNVEYAKFHLLSLLCCGKGEGLDCSCRWRQPEK